MECVDQLIVPVLERIGNKWEKGSVALSQVYMSGKICEEIVDTLLPPGNPDRKNLPKMAIAVIEDNHALGKRMVYASLRAAGFDLLDYGQGLTVEDIADRTKKDGIRILLLSALMLRAALRIKDLVILLKKEHPGTRIIVGGAPFIFDPGLAREVGADAMARTASDAVALVQRMTGESR